MAIGDASTNWLKTGIYYRGSHSYPPQVVQVEIYLKTLSVTTPVLSVITGKNKERYLLLMIGYTSTLPWSRQHSYLKTFG